MDGAAPKTIIVNEPDLQTRVIPTLENWYNREFYDKVAGSPRNRRLEGGLLLGCPLWGIDFVRTFLDYTLPSILAPENKAALAGRSRIVLAAPKMDAAVLWPALRQMECEHGIEFQLVELTPEVMALLGTESHPHLRYPVLGAVQSLLLNMAGRDGMAFHCLHPDHVYGHRYYPNLDRLSQEFRALAQTSISASIETAAAELDKFRDGVGLPVPDRDLGDIGYRNIHPRSQLSIMNDRSFPDRLPWSHLWNWRGRDAMHIACWHVNAAYMAPELCQRVPAFNLSTLDTQLPWYMPGEVGFPSADDGMTFIELSDASKPVTADPVDFDTFGHRVWGMVSYEFTHMAFLKMFSEVPIHEQESYVEVDEIRRQHAQLIDELVANRERLEETDEELAKYRKMVAAVQQTNESQMTAQP